MEKVNCAIFGYGYMGEIRHRMINKHPNLELKKICDNRVEKISLKEDCELVADPRHIIDSEVEAVFICTPNHMIPELAVNCLERGKHVFCEKPPGKTLDDIKIIRNAELNNPGTKLMFGFNHRYHPSIIKAKSIVDSNRLGSVVALRGLYGKSGGKNFSESWRNNFSISGGGILLDQGIHMLDLFNLFMGGFKSAKAFLSNDYWGFDVEDNAVVILKNGDNKLAVLHSSATFWKHVFQLNIILDKGYLKIEGLLSKTGSYGREKLVIGHREFEDISQAVGNPSEETIYFDKDLSWEIEVDMFATSILKNMPVNGSNSEDAYNAMKLVHLAYQDSDFPLYYKELI